MAQRLLGGTGESGDEARGEGEQRPEYTMQKRVGTRFWEVLDPTGKLVCLTVYRRGARELLRRLNR